MCNHKLGLTEDGRALICILPDCRTGGKPFVVAGGDKNPMPHSDIETYSKIKEIEKAIQKIKEENNSLQKQIDELRRILAGRGFITPRHGC